MSEYDSGTVKTAEFYEREKKCLAQLKEALKSKLNINEHTK